jgi:dTDP-glucose pyrophosphorylase
MDVLSKIKERITGANATILEALKKMDVLQVKLLFVFEDNSFKGLLSIGDIQRAIIRNESLETPVKNIIRKDITVAYTSEDDQSIKAKMVEFRTECMPVLDENGELADVYFWEEIFPTTEKRVNATLNVPVVIMAGGKGTRLKPLTNVLPKPLIPIGEKTIMEVIIDKFCQYGVCQFYISVNYKHELIRFYFDSIENKNYEINYIKEQDFLGTAGSLFLLKNKIHTTFFVSNCDILVDEDYSEIYNYHVDNKNAITLVASLKHFRIPYGTLESGVNGELLSLHEKPELTYMINTGMYVLNPEVLEQIPEGKFYHITDLIMDLKKKGEKVGVFPVSEKSWFDMGEWPEYQKVIDNYK